MKPLPHQQKFAKGYKDKDMLVHEGGTGKTICGALWLKDGRDADALVICPKRVFNKWGNTLTEWKTKGTVLWMEQFVKEPIKKWSAIIVDEADEFASPLFLKGRSNRSVALYKLIKQYPDTPVLLLTATPVRSTPWNLHTLLCFLGIYTDWKKWREQFFVYEHRPFLRWPAWFARPGWQAMMPPILEKHADIVLLKDCVNDLPPATHEVIDLPKKKVKKSTELHYAARFSEEHMLEQEDKVKHILEIAKEYRKVLVVAYYVDHVDALADALKSDREVFKVRGGVKDQEAILKKANEVDECFLVIQASLGAAFDADTFSAVIFTSMSYKVRDYVQMKYRVRRIHNLHPVVYYYLMGGKCDRQVYSAIQAGKDFVPSEYATTRTTEDPEAKGG